MKTLFESIGKLVMLASICFFCMVIVYIGIDGRKNYPEIYSDSQLTAIKSGDTIYARVCGDLMLVKVVRNDVNLHLITIKRPNFFDTKRDDYRLEESRTWDELSGNK